MEFDDGASLEADSDPALDAALDLQTINEQLQLSADLAEADSDSTDSSLRHVQLSAEASQASDSPADSAGQQDAEQSGDDQRLAEDSQTEQQSHEAPVIGAADSNTQTAVTGSLQETADADAPDTRREDAAEPAYSGDNMRYSALLERGYHLVPASCIIYVFSLSQLRVQFATIQTLQVQACLSAGHNRASMNI